MCRQNCKCSFAEAQPFGSVIMFMCLSSSYRLIRLFLLKFAITQVAITAITTTDIRTYIILTSIVGVKLSGKDIIIKKEVLLPLRPLDAIPRGLRYRFDHSSKSPAISRGLRYRFDHWGLFLAFLSPNLRRSLARGSRFRYPNFFRRPRISIS
jgi:hypothetical protein